MISGAKPQARFRVLNASSDAPSLNVHVNGSRAFSQVSYGQLTDYVPLAPGERTVRLYPAGMGVGEGHPLLTVTTNFHAESEYTLGAVGRAGEIEALTIKDDTPPAPGGRVRVRLLNVSPEAGPVDLIVRGGPDIFRNVGYKEATGYAEVDPGTVDLEFVPAGADQPFLTLAGVHLRSGARYTLVVLGRATGQPSPRVLSVADRQMGGLRL